MEKMRNVIRIKDVPSNTIEEAIIILKENKKVKKYDGYNKFKNTNNDGKNDNYVIKEAELIISNYLKNSEPKTKEQSNKKVKRLKIFNVVLILSLIVSIIL